MYKHWLRPAFASSAQLIAFVALIAAVILLPILISVTGIVSRQNSYEIMPEEHGAYSFVASEIFENDEDIDILFIGSSIQWNAIDTPQVQKAVSQEIGRDLRVISFGFNFNGIDIPYTQLRDLLSRKRVRMVVFSIPRLPFSDGPNATAYKFLRYDEYPEATSGLPLKYKTTLFANSVLRAPHDLLTLARKGQWEPSKYAADLGANKELMGIPREPANFVRFTPHPPTLSADDLLYSDRTNDRFTFSNEALPPYQEHYLNKLVELLDSEGIPLVMINVPQYDEQEMQKVTEIAAWGEKFSRDIPLIGIPPAVLFAGLSPEEIEMLHCDAYHFNKNGNEFFTAAILPAIVESYKRYSAKTH